MSKRGLTPASSGKGLTINPSEETPSPETAERDESYQNRADESALEQRIAEERASDKIGSVLDYAPYVVDQSPTQIFGMALIDSVKGDVSRIPNWKFKRWYFGKKVIVDFFSTKQAYKEAEVEARRSMARKFKIKYAALGPGMSYRTDLPEQLGL